VGSAYTESRKATFNGSQTERQFFEDNYIDPTSSYIRKGEVPYKARESKN
jgi:hypothetical protein